MLLRARGALRVACARGPALRWASAVPPRGEYATLAPEDLTFFEDVLGPRGVVTDPERLATMNRDWMGRWCGASTVALRPSTAEQVRLRWSVRFRRAGDS